MKSKSTFLRMFALLALMVPWMLQAQNAKVSEYDGSVTSATYSTIAGTSGASAWTADNQTAGYVDVQMPFAMYFGENQITTSDYLRVYPDGSAEFTSLTGSRIAPLYYSSGYNTTATSIYTKSTASVLTVEWRKVVSGTNSYSFQLKLYPGGDIEFCYGPMTINSSISVLVGMMSSSTDIFRCGGSDWDTVVRYTSDLATRTISSTYRPAYNTSTGVGTVYTFTQPACVKPTSLNATALSWDSIQVDWTVSSLGSGFELKYNAGADFDPATEGTSKTVNSGSDTSTYLTGLNGGTTYYIYLRKMCSGTPSGWTAVATATTEPGCYSANMPSVTSAGVVTWTSPNAMVTSYNIKYGPAGFTTGGTEVNNITALTYSIPTAGLTTFEQYDVYLSTNCSASGLSTDWVGPVTFSFFNGSTYTMGTDEDVTTCSAFIYDNGGPDGNYSSSLNQTMIVRPATADNNVRLQGTYNTESCCDKIYVYDGVGTSGDLLATYAGSGSINVVSSDLSGALTIMFHSDGGVNYDGFELYASCEPMPTCIKPTDLAEDSHTGTSVTLSWTENGTANAWQIAIDGDETNLIAANSNPFTLTGLTAEQTYSVKVRAYCAVDDQSAWSDAINVTPTYSSTLTINEGTTTNNYVPVYGYWADSYSRSQFVIPASDISAMQWGTITKLTFYSSNSSVSWGSAQFNVYLAEVGSTSISSLTDWNSMDVAYSGSLSISGNVMEITLTTPYQYMGGNLLIGTNEIVSGSYSSCSWYGVNTTGASVGGYNSSINQQNFLPKVTFNYIAGEPVTCFKPNSLTANNVSSTGAVLTWTELGTNTQWEVKVGSHGFNPDAEGTSYIVNTTPTLTLDYLYMVTDYDAYVRSICDSEDTTEWSNVCEFRTVCPNSSDISIGDHTSTNSYIPYYTYYNYSLSEQIYTAAELGGANTFTSLSYEVVSGGDSRDGCTIYLVETDLSSFSSVSDAVSVTGITPVYSGTMSGDAGWHTLDFDTPFQYSGTSNLVVVVDRGYTYYSSSYPSFGVVSTSSSQAIYAYDDGTDLTPENLGWNNDVLNYKNNFKFGMCDTGSCNAPQTAIALSETEYAATLTFTNVNEDVTNPTYGIIWGAQGFDPTTAGTTVSPISTSSYTISGLSAQTSYDVYVYAICSGTDGRMVRYTFTTPFIPNCKVPVLSESGYGASNIDYNTATISWRQPGDTPLNWTVRYAATDFNPSTAASGDYTELTATTASTSLTGLVAGTTYYVYVKATCSVSPVDESPWSEVYSFTTPTCVTPSNVSATDVTNSTAMIHWTEGGNATAWTVKYDISGFDPDAAGTAVSCTADSVELTGLDAYEYYDVYVKSNCTSTDESDWSSVVTFSTSCPGYSDPEDEIQLTIGEGTSTDSYLPSNTYYNYAISEQIYTAEELGGAGIINSLSINFTSTQERSIDIYLVESDKTSFSSSSDWVAVTSANKVYSGSLCPDGTGWNIYELTTPFTFSGRGNLVLVIDDNSGTYEGSAYSYVSSASNKALYLYDDYTNFDPTNPPSYGNLTSYRNNIKLGIQHMVCDATITCFAPATVNATVSTDNTVAVTWTARTDLRPVVNNFELNYGPAGFNPETSGTVVSNLNNVFNYNITDDLAVNTEYDVYVRTVCDADNDDNSDWTKASFTTYPSCWAPTELAVTGTTTSSATLSWTENTPTAADRWEVIYGIEGFDTSSVTPIETTNNTQFVVNGLRHSTRYEFYVRAKCDENDHSDWSTVATGTTQCGIWTVADLPLTEDFESYSSGLPNCWLKLGNGTGAVQTTTVNNGSKSLKFSGATSNNIVALPAVNNTSADPIILSFYTRPEGFSYSNCGTFDAGYITDIDDVTTFVSVENYTYSDFSAYEKKEVQIDTLPAGARPAFRHNAVATNYFWFVDDVTVKVLEHTNLLADAGQTIAVCNEFVMPDTTNGGSYHNELNSTWVVRPAEAGKVAHLTGSYDLENGYDFLNVYRGAAVSANLLGRYTGEGTIDYVTSSNLWADSGYFTLVLTTDADNAFDYEGFKLLVSCECPQPAADIIPETVEEIGTYTWRNGTTYTNNIVRTGLTYDATAAGVTADDLIKNVDYTYTNVAGCDSVSYSLALTLHPTYSLTYDAEICERDTFAFYGNDYSATGTYTVTLTSQYGADSTGVLNLQRHPAPTAGIYYNNRVVTSIADYCDNADLTILARSNNANATFLWEDSSAAASRVVNPHESNTYTVVATESVYGCTSTPASVTVTTVPVPELTISGDAEICYGESTTLTLTDANNVDATYRWSTGATTASITVNPTVTTTYTVTATTANASACTATAEFTVTVNALPVVAATASVAEICRDSVVTLTATEVDGYSYSWNTGATTATATVAAASTGSYTVTVTDQNGCVNEFSTSSVTVHPSYEVNDDLSVCYTHNPYTWGDMTITANGDYDQTFTIAHGCDSLVHLTFTFEEMGIENSNIERCYGSTYTFEDITRTATADTNLYYIDNSGDCPVRYNLAVVVNPVKATTIEQTVCDTYTWNVSGETYTTTGAYPVTLATTKNCDSVVTLNLTVNYQNTGVETVTACDKYVWDLNGVSYTATTNTPTYTLQNQYGCDSVVTLDLTVNYRSYHEDFHCVSDALTYTWDDGETYSLNVAVSDSVEFVTGTNADGCNEIALLHLVMNPVTDTLNWTSLEVCDEYEIQVVNVNSDCEGETETVYLRESGDYELRTPNATAGHDQWTRLHLTVSNSAYHTTVVEACLPYEWMVNVGTETEPVYYSVATITEEMINSDEPVFMMSYQMPDQYTNGCSRIEVLRLTPKFPTVETIEATICQNGSWTAENDVTYYGVDLTLGDNLLTWDNSTLNADGCPLTKKVNLTVNPVYNTTADLTFCESEFVLNETSGIYELTVNDANHDSASVVLTIPGALNEVAYQGSEVANWLTVNGCDSIVTINYTVTPTLYENTLVADACHTYTWDVNGSVYNEAGHYTDTVYDMDATTACMLVKTLDLTVLGTAKGYDTINVCTSYEGPDAVTYRETKTFEIPYEGTDPIVGGCDSITLVTYNVLQNTLTEEYILVNADYTWRDGNTYTESTDGVYYYEAAANGECEDVYLLHLTMVDPIVICENSLPYTATYGNSTFVIPADAADNGFIGNGTDTILNFTVLRNTAETVTETVCDSYTWSTGNGETYTATGDYEWTTTNVAGCDSVVTLDLTVNVSTAETVTATACDSYTWSTGNGETYDTTGVYTWTTTNVAGCDSVVTLDLTINVNAGVEIAQTSCVTYTWEQNGQTYTNDTDEPVVADYTYAYTDANGCTGDSTLHLTLNPAHATNSTIVVNDSASYLYNGVLYTAPCDTTFSTTFTNQYGCDSIHTLTLIIPVAGQITEVEVEACGSYTWNIAGVDHTYEWMSATDRMNHGMALYKDVTFNKYVYTFPTDTTFDATTGAMLSVEVLHLNLLEKTTSVDTVNVPVSLGTYTINGVAGDLLDVAVETFTFGYADRGTSFDTTVGVGSVVYCNDFRTYTINLIDNYDTTEVYACADETSYNWNGTDYAIGTPGHTYFFVQKENEGTMTELVHVLKLNQRAVNAATTTLTVCDTYTWLNGDSVTYTTSGTYVYNYIDENQCAATKTLELTVNYNSNAAFTDAACDTYTWTRNNQTYTASGDYLYNYTTDAGCNSTDTLHLTINNNSNQGYTDAACNSYTWARDGQDYTVSGTYTYSYTADNGCPSVDTLHLTINLPTDQTIDSTVCDSMEWNGTMYYTSGIYNYDYVSEAGCASTDQLNLTVNNATHNAETTTQCDSYEWNGTAYTASGEYTYAYTNAAGCASVDTLYLTINVNTSTIHDTITACDEYTWAVNNRLYNTSGNATATTTDDNGCATTNTLTLTINASSSYDSVLYISDGSYRYYGQNATELFGEGVYNRSEIYTNAAGCDSTLNITFNVGTALLGVDNVINCTEYTWRNGETYVWISAEERAAHLNEDNVQPLYKTINGTYIYYNPTFTVERENAYDSIYMLALTLTQSYNGYDEVTVNVSDAMLTYGDSVFNFSSEAALQQNFVSETREYDVHFAAVQYCDSIITLTVNLVNNYQEVTADAADICVTENSYTWREHTISTATSDYDNVHTYYIYDTLGTGIIEYITVTQHPLVYATERRTACDSYEWNGETYTESTSTATAFFQNGSQYGCDSTVTLILTINHNTSTTLTTAACETYTWTAANGGNGETYTESGVYTYDYNTDEGCPSTNTLELTINTNTSTAYTVDECDSYTWNATNGDEVNTFTASGVYTYDYLTAEGCPSTDTLTLTIRKNSDTIYNVVACDTYTWTAENGGNDTTYTASGIYNFDYTAENGCPSTNTLNLTVNQNSSTAYTVSACDSYTWNSTDYTASGDYTYDYTDANNCPSVDTLHLTVNNSTVNVATVVECNSYEWTATDNTVVGTYTASGEYEYTYLDVNGCTVTDSLYLTIGSGRAFGIAHVTNCGPYTWVVEGDTIAVLDESVETSTSVTNPATGCDSTIFLYLTVNPMNVTEATICDNSSYTWTVNNTVYTTAGTYDEVTTDANGNCQSTERLVLTVNETKATALTDQICLGNGYTANGFDIAATELANAGEYTFIDSLTTTLGCDSIVTLTLTVGDIINNPVEATACDSYDWNAGDGQTYTYTASGTYNSEAYANAQGCTTVDVLTLTINQNAGTEYTETVCDGYMWNGTQYTESGDYTYDYTDGNGCASTDILHLTVNNSVVNTIEKTVCDSYEWTDGNGENYTASGVYTYNYETADGCSATDYLVLTVNYSDNTEETVTACDSYDWYGTTYTESGDYTYTDVTEQGCESTHTIALTINYNTNSSITETSCGLFVWKGLACAETGDYTYSYMANGCPSVDTLHLTVYNPVTVTIDTTVCGAFEWNGIRYESSDVLTHTYTAANGCDSTEVVNLTVNMAAASAITETACDSYFWELNGNTYTTSGSYSAILEGEAANGCDSVVTLTLTVNNNTSSATTVSACDSYEWNGTTYTTSGTQTYAYESENGCPSVDTLYLTVNNSATSTETATACGSYTWNGNTYTASGNYNFATTTVAGCDSVATLALTITTAEGTNETVTACDSYTWNGTTYTTAGTYYHDFTVDGCAGTDTLNLTLNYNTSGSETVAACESYTWNGSTYAQSGTYTYNYTSGNCTSVDTLYLTVNQGTTGNFSASACNYYVWNGQAYDETGTYTQTLEAANGCDSVVTMSLTINTEITTSFSESVCGSYTWNGATYTATGAYTQNFNSVAGCDSVVTLNLTILPAVTNTDNQTSCSSYEWNGQTYTTSGTYTYTYTAANGCDSIVTLNLTITPAITSYVSAAACDSYTWNGITYTTTGTYTQNLTAANGCDSIVVLNLTINTSTEVVTTETACDSYTWNGITYYESTVDTIHTVNTEGCGEMNILNLTINHSTTGIATLVACDSLTWIDDVTYYNSTNVPTFTLTNAAGCDSTVMLNLTINRSNRVVEDITACDSYTWNTNGVTYTESIEGVSVTNTNIYGCDSVNVLNLTVNYSVSTIEEVNGCDSYTWIDGVTYTNSTNTPTVTLTTEDGCDSVVTLHLTMHQSVESYDTLSVEAHELPYYYVTRYLTEPGDYDIVLTTETGCDSTVHLHFEVTNAISDVDVLSDLTVYPNPTRGQLTVSVDNVLKIEVLDIVGRKVAVFENTNSFDISNLTEGAYTLRITLPEGITVRKVVKK